MLGVIFEWVVVVIFDELLCEFVDWDWFVSLMEVMLIFLILYLVLMEYWFELVYGWDDYVKVIEIFELI